MSRKLVQLKDGDNEVFVKRSYEDFTYEYNIMSGDAGTRAAQKAYGRESLSADPVSVEIIRIGDSNAVHPLVFINQSDVYLNIYRASTNASSSYVTIRVFYS